MRPFLDAPGKAMIVCATREICANLYSAIVALRPGWHSDDLDKGVIKVVYSGTPSDTSPVVDHVRRDSQNAVIKERLREVDDELEIVIVKDMMLTGYDSPPLHTLYLDRPLKGALLMQTLARVNRTFRGKEDGPLVAYAPLADNLQKALSEYTQQDRESKPLGRDAEEAVALTETLMATLGELLSGFDWKAVLHGGGKRAFLHAVHKTVEYVRAPATPGRAGRKASDSGLRGSPPRLAPGSRVWPGRARTRWSCTRREGTPACRHRGARPSSRIR
jgi:type I restriction enzyme R subunit